MSTIISASLAVVKRTCFDHIDRHVGQSSRREYSYNFQKDSNLSRLQMTLDMWTQIEAQIGIELETRRNENSNLKQSMSILCNNCNMQICIGRDCHVLITTRSFVCTNQINYVYILPPSPLHTFTSITVFQAFVFVTTHNPLVPCVPSAILNHVYLYTSFFLNQLLPTTDQLLPT